MDPAFRDAHMQLQRLSEHEPLATEHTEIILIGRPPVGEFIGQVTTQTVAGDKSDIGQLMNEWRAANDHVGKLEAAEAGFADQPAMLSLPDSLAPLALKVHANDAFRRAYQLVPSHIALVELDRLVVYQKHISLEHVQRIQMKLGDRPSEIAVFNLCVPADGSNAAVKGRRVAQNAFVFTSPSNDLRLLEPVLLEPSQLVNYTPPGHAAGVIALVMGFGPNCLAALHVEGRLVLQNGSHRAYALRDMGITHAPAVIQDVSRRAELELFGIPALTQSADDYLSAPRPPVLKDYFDDRLRKAVVAPQRYQQLTIQFGTGQGWLDIPAA